MDINIWRSFFTVLIFAIFVGVTLWAWSSRRKNEFDEAAQLPFWEDDQPVQGVSSSSAGEIR